MPSLFSQFVPSISSMLSDDLDRSGSERSISFSKKLDSGRSGSGVETGAIARSVVEEYGVAGSNVFCVTQVSAIGTGGLTSAAGATTGRDGGGETIPGGENGGVYEAVTGRSGVFGVASSAGEPGR